MIFEGQRALVTAVLLLGVVSGCVQGGPAGPWSLGSGGPARQSATPAAEADPLRQNMVASVNRERLAHGAMPLRIDAALNRAAQSHAEDMAASGVFSHRGSDGSDAGDRLVRMGYRYRTYGENIAQGQQSVAEVVAAWMASRTHRRIMLDPSVADLGIGYAGGRHAGRLLGDRPRCALTATRTMHCLSTGMQNPVARYQRVYILYVIDQMARPGRFELPTF